jgi:hypothetical protein
LRIIIDWVPWRNGCRLFGILEGRVASGAAQLWRVRSILPSTSAPCHASIHRGVAPQVHGVRGNEAKRRRDLPDIFSAVAAAGGKGGAVTHSFWSELFNRAPFDPVRDLEYDDPAGPIHHGRFHTMRAHGRANRMTPADADLFATLTMLCERRGIDDGILHSCTLESMGIVSTTIASRWTTPASRSMRPSRPSSRAGARPSRRDGRVATGCRALSRRPRRGARF